MWAFFRLKDLKRTAQCVSRGLTLPGASDTSGQKNAWVFLAAQNQTLPISLS